MFIIINNLHSTRSVMAIRIKTKWHRSKRSRRNIEGSAKEKTVEDLASAIAFNTWKLAQETYRRMIKEGFRFEQDAQVTRTMSEITAFIIQYADRMVFPYYEDEQRSRFIIALAGHMADTVETNHTELFGEGNYRAEFIDVLNVRLADYAEFPYDDTEGPSYAAKRYLGEKISEVMQATDNKWVIEQVIDIEAPEIIKSAKRLITDVLGLRHIEKIR